MEYQTGRSFYWLYKYNLTCIITYTCTWKKKKMFNLCRTVEHFRTFFFTNILILKSTNKENGNLINFFCFTLNHLILFSIDLSWISFALFRPFFRWEWVFFIFFISDSIEAIKSAVTNPSFVNVFFISYFYALELLRSKTVTKTAKNYYLCDDKIILQK